MLNFDDHEASPAFAGLVAHDLKAPLRAVGGYTRILRADLTTAPEDGSSSTNLELMDKICGTVDRMTSLIEDLLSFATARDRTLRPQQVDLQGLVAEIVAERTRSSTPWNRVRVRTYDVTMASLDDVARIASALPEVAEGENRAGRRTWSVGKKCFAWERQFSKADLKRFGDTRPPDGPILAVQVEDLEEKKAVLAAGRSGFFTIPHFDGYSAVLIQLSAVDEKDLAEAVLDGFLACAPPRLSDRYLER